MSADKQALEGLRLNRAEEDAVAPRGGWLKGWVLLAVLGGILVYWFWPARPIEVRSYLVQPVDPAELRTLLNASGYVTARREATVSSKITGKVVEVAIEEGQRVAAGDILARLDDLNAAANLRYAGAQTGAARAALAETRVRLEVALRDLERVRQLRSTGVATEASLDQAQGEVDSLKARLERQLQEVEVAERQQAVQAQLLEDTIIRAPFGGVVTTKNAQPGEMISPISAGSGYTRTGICTIVDMTSLEIEVDVNESYLGRVQEEQPVMATLDAYPGWRIPARVIAIIPTADRQKSTVKVRVGFEKLDPRILPEMAVRVAFLGPPPPGLDGSAALLVPSRAVLRTEGQTWAWVIAEGKVSRSDLRVGEEFDGEQAILEGLQAGDRVVIEGFERLREGSPIREKTR